MWNIFSEAVKESPQQTSSVRHGARPPPRWPLAAPHHQECSVISSLTLLAGSNSLRFSSQCLAPINPSFSTSSHALLASMAEKKSGKQVTWLVSLVEKQARTHYQFLAPSLLSFQKN